MSALQASRLKQTANPNAAICVHTIASPLSTHKATLSTGVEAINA